MHPPLGGGRVAGNVIAAISAGTSDRAATWAQRYALQIESSMAGDHGSDGWLIANSGVSAKPYTIWFILMRTASA